MQVPKGVGILLNSEAPITVEGRSEGMGVSSISERGITQTEVKVPKCQLSIK